MHTTISDFKSVLLHKIRTSKVSVALVSVAFVAAFSLLVMGVLFKSGLAVEQNSDIQAVAMNDEMQDEQSLFAKKAETANGYALYIDGSFVAVCDSREDAEEALEMVKNLVSASYGVNSEDSSIANSVVITEGLFEKDSIIDKYELLKMFGVEGNTLSAGSLGLDISYTVQKSETETIPFEIMYLDTDEKTDGYTRTLQEGTDGLRKVDYEIEYINDEEVEENVVTEDVVIEAVPEIIERGVESGSEMTSASLKMFELPYVGRITSYFGWRILESALDYHDGLDLASIVVGESCYGDDVLAAGDGVVVTASYASGYGNYIVIQHSNGLKTGYAHLSVIGVTVGQEVNTGDVIGQIGSTGKSTGPHLHFEVIIGGEKTDPLPFLKSTELLG